jgi:tRNA pseudouridine38-40 synthase
MFCATVDVTDADAPHIPPERLPIALNRYLPTDISVRSAEIVADDFHPRYAVAWKQYCYRIYTAPTRDPFLADRVYHVPRKLDVERMQAAASQFVGRHDFAGFMASGSDVQDTVRTIYHFAVTQEGDMVEVRVAADGFLYNMVRILVGTLLAVSAGKLSPAEIPALLAAKDRSQAGETAPACGLYLEQVSYTPYPLD